MSMPAFQLPNEHQMAEAQAAVDALRRLPLDSERQLQVVSRDSRSDIVTLPREMLGFLTRLLAHIANGHAVTLIPVEAELTSQQAADLLGVSRPYLVKLLDEDVIPHHKVGRHRRVRANDLLVYKQRRDAEARKAADELTAQAQELGMGY